MPVARLPGIALHYIQIPDARRVQSGSSDIVMIHGLAASSAFWYGAGAQRLARFGRVTAYDLRGHGRSEMPENGYRVSHMVSDLEQLMDALDIKKAHLVAHSFGGMIALLFALRHPQRVASLVLADVRVRPVQPEIRVRRNKLSGKLKQLEQKLGFPLETQHSEGGLGYLEQIARIQLMYPDEADAILKQLYGRPIQFFSRRAARRWIDLLERASLLADMQSEDAFTRKDLARITQPILVLAGAKSTTLASCRALAKECPHARLMIIPGLGHFFPISAPAMFLRPVMRFLRHFPKLTVEPVERQNPAE